MFGTPKLWTTEVYPAIAAFRKHYETRQDTRNSQETHKTTIRALEVRGAVAWIIHNAVKRNHQVNRLALKAAEEKEASNEMTSSQVLAPVKNDVPKTVMWDPVRDV